MFNPSTKSQGFSLPLLAVLSSVFFVLIFILFKSFVPENNTASRSVDNERRYSETMCQDYEKLFIGYSTDISTLTAKIVNLDGSEELVTTIDTVDNLMTSAYSSHNSSNSAIYDDATNSLFYLTEGVCEAHCPQLCDNADGTCFDRIYKHDLVASDTTVFYQPDEISRISYVQLVDGSLYVLTENADQNTRSLVRISVPAGTVESVVENSAYLYPGPFVINHKTNEAESILRGYKTRGLVKNIVDLSTGDVTLEPLSDLVYDPSFTMYRSFHAGKRQLSYIDGEVGSSKLHFMDLVSGEIMDVETAGIKNRGTHWNGLGDKLIHMPASGVSYYDLNSRKTHQLNTSLDYVLLAQPSCNKVIVFENPNVLEVHDLESNIKLTTLEIQDLNGAYNIRGLQWIN